MNDELSGQLTSSWHIPSYAQDMLWLVTDDSAVQVEGEHGLFQLEYPAKRLTLHWGAVDGPALKQFNWQADTLDWSGEVRVGGRIDYVHLMQLPGAEFEIAVLPCWGTPLLPDHLPYPDVGQRKKLPYASMEFENGLADNVDEGLTTWLVEAESPLLSMAQDGMTNDNDLYLWGYLANEVNGFHVHFALPLLLTGLTFFPHSV